MNTTTPEGRASASTFIALLTVAGLIPAAGVGAQPLKSTLGPLVEENATLYVEPVTRGFSHAMTAPFFEGARVRGPLGFDVGVRAMAALPPEEARSFTPVLPQAVTVPELGRIEYPYGASASETPTATGAGPGLALEPAGEFRQELQSAGVQEDEMENYALVFPDGLDIPAIPFAALDGRLGIGLGTEVTVRLIPDMQVNEDIGRIDAVGFGARHQFTSWLSAPAPLDLAISAGFQRFSAGDYLDATGRRLGLAVSRTMGAITVFVEGAARDSNVDVEYTFSNPRLEEGSRTVRFSSDLDATGSLAAGAHLQLGILNVAGQFTASEYDTVSLRLGVGAF